MGPLLARPEEREREMAAQAQEARERIAEPTALLDGFDTAAEKFRITRKTLLELPDPSLPVPPERCTRWWVGPVGLLPPALAFPLAKPLPCPPLPHPSAPPRRSRRSRTHAPGGGPRRVNWRSAAAPLRWRPVCRPVPGPCRRPRRSTRPRRAGRTPCAAHWRGCGRRAARPSRHQRRARRPSVSRSLRDLDAVSLGKRHHLPARRGDAPLPHAAVSVSVGLFAVGRGGGSGESWGSW